MLTDWTSKCARYGRREGGSARTVQCPTSTPGFSGPGEVGPRGGAGPHRNGRHLRDGRTSLEGATSHFTPGHPRPRDGRTHRTARRRARARLERSTAETRRPRDLELSDLVRTVSLLCREKSADPLPQSTGLRYRVSLRPAAAPARRLRTIPLPASRHHAAQT